MEQRVLSIETRDKVGKGVSRRLRLRGRIPAVVYGKGIDPVAVSVDKRELAAAIAGEGGINHLITLKGGGELDGKVVIVADLTRHCLKGEAIHVDLHKVNMEEKVRVKVPVCLKGSARGVKEGGLLDFVMHNIEIECLPAQIPEHIEIDVTSLGIGGSLHIADVPFPAGVKVLEDPKATVINILGKAAEAAQPAEAAE